jgi:uncharacterized protein (TIGR03067 family)
MRLMLIFSALMISSCGYLAPVPTPKDPQVEMEELNGTWKVISKKVQGIELIGKHEKETFVTFKNGEFTWADDGAPPGKIVSIDPSKSPKEVDYLYTGGVEKGKTHKAIYHKLNADTFTDCFGPSGTARPQEFKSTADNNLTVMVYVRVKK